MSSQGGKNLIYMFFAFVCGKVPDYILFDPFIVLFS